MLIRCLDVETTGLPSDDDPHALVEVGWCDLDGDLIGPPEGHIVNPGRTISVEAMAVHHLRDEDVAGGVNPTTACKLLAEGDRDYYCAHNIDFEKMFFGGGEVGWLCTYKSALRVWPDAPGHKVQELRYWLKLDDQQDFVRGFASQPHRARDDAYVTAHVLRAMLRAGTKVEDISKWSRGPALLVMCFMKKHKGRTWQEVARTDRPYLEWIVDKSDVTDRDIRATVKYWLKQTAPK